MAIAARYHVIYDPAVSTAPLVVTVDDAPSADQPVTSGRGARVAAFVLVPLSLALVALWWVVAA